MKAMTNDGTTININAEIKRKSFNPKINPTVKDSKLKRYQHIHSVIWTSAGLLGMLTTIYLAYFIQPLSMVGISLFFIMFFFVGMGLTIGYHRHFTHSSYKAHPAIRAILAVLGCMAGQGPVIFWVALHRMHHAKSDQPGDPHSPNLFGQDFKGKAKGLLHAYIGWTVKHEVPNANFYAKDLLKDKLISSINRYYYSWIFLGLLIPTLLGGIISQTWYGALEGLLLGGFVRMFALHNVIWWITSFAHVFGKREYQSKDLSTNNFWLAIPTLGESWHNNHHAFPKAAILNFKWWQIDLSGLVLIMLEKLGLVWNLHRPSKEILQKNLK